MAFAPSKRPPCSKCNKAAGILTCRGCGKDFCYTHVAEHRQELNRKMDDLTIYHDQFQQTICEQHSQPHCHPLMGQIDLWEQESIDKIQEAAYNARKELLVILGAHRVKVTNELKHLTAELNIARINDDFVETDLKVWIDKLNRLKKQLSAADIINFGQEDHSDALVSKIFINGISTDIFEHRIGDIQILENGTVAVHGQTYQNAAVRGRSEYSFGQHRLHFKMEQSSSNGGFIFGILSKSTPLESLLYIATNNSLYQYNYSSTGTCNARNQNGISYFTTFGHNIQNNEVAELLVDCDRCIIRLTIGKTHQRYELDIDVNLCPLPWQFFITLVHPNSRIRICEENTSVKPKRKYQW